MNEPKNWTKRPCDRCGEEFTTDADAPGDHCSTCTLAKRAVGQLSAGSTIGVRPADGEPYVARVDELDGDLLLCTVEEAPHRDGGEPITYHTADLVDGFARDVVERVQQCDCGQFYSIHSYPGACFACAVGLENRAGGTRYV